MRRAFDTDVLSDILDDRPDYLERLSGIPVPERFVPVVVATEVLRGSLGTVRNAEAGKAKCTLPEAFALFEKNLLGLAEFQPLPYTVRAEESVADWLRTLRHKVGINDLRIAGIAVAHGITLVTRNRRDYGLVPGLSLEIWT